MNIGAFFLGSLSITNRSFASPFIKHNLNWLSRIVRVLKNVCPPSALLNVTGPLRGPCLGDGYSKDARQKSKHGSWP